MAYNWRRETASDSLKMRHTDETKLFLDEDKILQISLNHVIDQSIDFLVPSEIKGHWTKMSGRSKDIVGISLIDMFISSMCDLEEREERG